MEKQKRNSGITLIALVITIIVLLILAGISISMVLGDNGIINQSVKAREETRAASVEEARDLWRASKTADKLASTTTAQTLEELLNDLQREGQITASERDEIEKTGQVKIGSRIIDFTIADENNSGYADSIEDFDEDTRAKLTAGKYVNYKYMKDGKEETILCQVLYDEAYNKEHGTDYGIQIGSVYRCRKLFIELYVSW